MSIHQQSRVRRSALLCGAAAIAVALAAPAMAQEQVAAIDIKSQPMETALRELARQSGVNLLFSSSSVKGLNAPAVQTQATPEAAARMLLAGTDLSVVKDSTGSLIIQRAAAPQSSGAAGDGAEVEALIVTAQKREEDIQDVPIAISAFTQEALERSQIAGGPDLITQVPNMTFTKTNFTSYSIQIRGIGTQAISATTDAAVAVAFNNTPFIRNRFFEQEFYDLERVEVLRGPQGTLYGRNATAGVVNIISAKPRFVHEAKLSADIANYSSKRLEGMINIPIVEDSVALRLAGAWTGRDGFAMNQLTGQPIDGRDLWSARASLRIEPTATLSINLIYEHFEEDDDRLRSGKQLCHTDPNPTEYGGVPIPPDRLGGGGAFSINTYSSQGCRAASLYAPESFQTPNGYSMAYYGPLGNIGAPIFFGLDPYVSTTQSTDLRVIESMLRPEYKASSDLAELQVSIDLTPSLTLTSETGYNADRIFSFQDFNRFNTKPGVWAPSEGLRPGLLSPEGVYCDPQLGCSDRLVAGDLATAASRQFSQELRLTSSFDGGFNFSVGANYLRYDTEDKYYVFVNGLNLATSTSFAGGDRGPYIPGEYDESSCGLPRRESSPWKAYLVQGCYYIDPNNIHNLNDLGRNYFLSKNPYGLISYAAFGEIYYEVTPDLRLTAGARLTVDKKTAPQIPSWLLASGSYGYPVRKVIDQEWREPTGRLGIDWRPTLPFTDETLLYASLAHGYKAGGANPPPAIHVTYTAAVSDAVIEESISHPETFAPEFVDAFEVGAKNTLLGGALTLNVGGFYYDYEGYQVSQIVDRSAVNLNFDARIWGVEVEADWRPLENLRLGFKGGYENTRMADGSRAIDLMDRTAGNPDWVVFKPFAGPPSNCILPLSYVSYALTVQNGMNLTSGALDQGPCISAYYAKVDPLTAEPYVPNPDPVNLPGYAGFDPAAAPNNGEGFTKDLSGNELPNAPHYTASLTADYTLPLPDEWLLTLHTDLYYQSEAWARVFNTDGYDKIKAYTNVNLAAIFANDASGWQVMAYVKNVLDRDTITGAFLNSDDTGLTTNVFLTEPRLYGVRVSKQWTGGPLWGGSSRTHKPGEPYLLTVELGAGVDRIKVANESLDPFTSEFAQRGLPTLGSTQAEDLDWGDGRDVKITYSTPGGLRIGAAHRHSETNGTSQVQVQHKAPGGYVIGDSDPDKYIQPNKYNYVNSTTRGAESHTLVDFTVGSDVGIGLAAGFRNSIEFGLRYAQFKSATVLDTGGAVYYMAPTNSAKYPITNHQFSASLDAEREFRGAGPVLTWDGSKSLLGNDASGWLRADWEVSGGVLFGKSSTSLQSDTQDAYAYFKPFGAQFETVEVVPFSDTRSESVTVPSLALGLGLSYEVDRFKVSGGYRWERFFDVIDGGITEAKQYDRTIDGPYFTVAVGFGG